MNIKEITIDDKSDLEFIEKLYIESFPLAERRPVLKMHHLMENSDEFKVCILTDEVDIRVGFLNYWVFDKFIYLEHFAVSSEHRSGGYGRKALEKLIGKTTLPLIGEIELPSSSDLAMRRLKFYENIGFRPWYDLAYMQPPYEEGGGSIPMLLLTYRDIDLENCYECVKNQIYSVVYGCASV